MTICTYEPTELAALADRAGRDLEGAPADEVLGWAVDTFGDRFAVAASMGDTVLTHLASRVRPGIDVLFIDTGYHFAETIGTRDAVEAVYPVTVVDVRARLTVAEQDAEHGPRLHDRDPDLCCSLRKVQPLNDVLEGYDAWAGGARRDEAVSRRFLKAVAFDARRGKIKVSPLASWTQADVDAYAEEHGVLVNPLLYDGYTSVGCAPCTRRTLPGEDPRAGRWSGTGKTECGINL